MKNPVKKFMDKIHKPRVHKERKKYSRKEKHKARKHSHVSESNVLTLKRNHYVINCIKNIQPTHLHFCDFTPYLQEVLLGKMSSQYFKGKYLRLSKCAKMFSDNRMHYI